MTQDGFNLHYTLTTPITGGDRDGWDFSCETCGYHARYMLGDEKTQYRLEILAAGDPNTRHIGPYNMNISPDPCDELTNAVDEGFKPEQSDPDESLFDEQTWLTPELREQLSLILDRLDD